MVRHGVPLRRFSDTAEALFLASGDVHGSAGRFAALAMAPLCATR